MVSIKRVFLAVSFSVSLYAALPAGLVWEVRTAGNFNNGGCFVAGGSGTDFSQQNAAQYSFADLTVDAVTNTIVTSASHNFVAADVDNCLHVTAGVGWTQGWYRIVSVSMNAATLDRSPAAVGVTNGTFAVGGALAALQTPLTNLVSGNIVYIKNDGTYTTTANITAANVSNFAVLGYTTTRGDNGKATIQANASVAILAPGGNSHNAVFFRDLILNCNSQTSTVAVFNNTGSLQMMNIDMQNCTGDTFQSSGGGSSRCVNCVITNQASGGGFNLNAAGDQCWYCRFLDPTSGTGVAFLLNSRSLCFGCVGEGHPSATNSDVYQLASTSGPALFNSVCYNAGRDCLRVTDAQLRAVIYNNVFYTAGGFCINFTGLTFSAATVLDYNGVGNCTSGSYNGITAGANDVALSADPFSATGSNNFALNNTAGGGAALRAVGFPGVTTGGTGFVDIGALQSQAGGTPVAFGFAQ